MIAFSGLDGAGKSTQIDLLQEFLKNKNIKSIVFWSRGGYTPGIEFFKGLMRKFKSKKIPTHRGNSQERDHSFSNPLVRKTWLVLALLDLIFFYGFYIRFKEIFGTKIMCDRYIYDTLIDFKLNFPQENVENWWIWKFLLFIAVKPKKYFVLTIPVIESQKRSILKNEPFPDSQETLANRLENYLTFANNNKDVVNIDAVKSINEIHNQIINEIKLIVR